MKTEEFEPFIMLEINKRSLKAETNEINEREFSYRFFMLKSPKKSLFFWSMSSVVRSFCIASFELVASALVLFLPKSEKDMLDGYNLITSA